MQIQSTQELMKAITTENHQLDCLILENTPEVQPLFDLLRQQSILMPAVILTPQPQTHDNSLTFPQCNDFLDPQNATELDVDFIYHCTEVQVGTAQLKQIKGYIDKAISQFITHAITARLTEQSSSTNTPTELTNFLIRQQRRLMSKLHERLGYLGVYYKRNSQNFLRNLPPVERQEFVEQLKSKYRQIVLNYFSGESSLNNQIDEYVNLAFFADVPVTKIVEIHMELMDNFSKQLKLEGRSEDVLLDYRLTLIDTIAHLCEMYRRSIPRES